MTYAAVEEELVRVLGYYALGELRAAQRTEHGFVNDNWIVDMGRGRHFLKRRHPDLRQPDLIRAQHGLIERLRQANFPAPTVVPTATGETFLVLGDEFYEIHKYIEGEPYDHGRPVHLEEAALTLGRYHVHIEGFAPQALCDLGELYSPTILSTILTHLTRAWRLDRDSDPSTSSGHRLAQVARQLEAQAADLAARFAGHGALPHLVIHGDYYAGNLLFDGDRIVGVVDYDKARWQPRVVELAEALIYFASPRPGHLKHLVYPGFLDWEPFARFLQNYARAAVLNENEMRALPDYIRCIWLSVSLERLLEKESRPAEGLRPEPFDYAQDRLAEGLEALREVLALGRWADANAHRMLTYCKELP